MATRAENEPQTGQGIGAENEEVRPQPGAEEMQRIIAALKVGREPAETDADAACKAFAPDSAGMSVKDGALLTAQAAMNDGDPKRAWEAVAPLLESAQKPITDWKAITVSDRDWLIDKWLPAGRIGMLSGTGGAGKSMLATQLAAAIASGEREWLGRPGVGNSLLPLTHEKDAAVVYAGYEDEPEEIRRRLGWIEARYRKERGKELLPLLEDRMAYTPMAQRGPVWAVAPGETRHGRASLTLAGAWLRAYCKARKARLLIVDPLASAYGADENDNAAAAEFISDWGGWATDSNCAVLLVHHFAKTEAQTGEGEGYRGASAWQGGVRYLWRLQDDQLEPRKMSYALPPASVYLTRDKPDTGNTWQAAADQAPRTKNTALCGAKTAAGTPCKARGKAEFGGRCAQHQEQAHGADQVKVRGEMVDE